MNTKHLFSPLASQRSNGSKAKLLTSFLTALSMSTGLALGQPIIIDGKRDVTISGAKISNPSGPCIEIKNNSQNIKIINSELGPCATHGVQASSSSSLSIENSYIHDTTGNGVEFYQVSNASVTGNRIERSAAGVYALLSTRIVVENNRFQNVLGPMPRGEFVQFNQVYGGGNRIKCNTAESIAGQGDPQDGINLFGSNGTATDPIQVIGNKIRGGGPSMWGGGILLGDGGGSWQVAKDNIVVDPGQYGVGIAGGQNNQLLNNTVYARSQFFTNVGVYVWNQYGPACSSITVQGNIVNYTNRDGLKTPWWEGGNCGSIAGLASNNWSAAIDAGVFDQPIAACQTQIIDSIAPSVAITSPGNGQSMSTLFTAHATATDNVGIAGVTFKVDGTTVGSEDTTAPYSVAIDPANLAAGSHTMTAVARDSSGNVTQSTGVKFDIIKIETLNPAAAAHVSDLPFRSIKNGYGPTEKDRSNGEHLANDGRTITLNGVSFLKGLGVHANSEVRLSLGGTCSTFTSRVGVDDEVGALGSVVFQVWGDGTKLFDSGVMTGTTATRDINVNLTGRSELVLIVTDAGDGIHSDHANWAEPRVSCSIGTPTYSQYLSDLAWRTVANGYGPVEKDRSNGEHLANDGKAITLSGRAYSKGLGVHANSEVRYTMGGRCTAFTASIGVDDEVAERGSVVFQVWADGAKLYESGIMTGLTATQNINVNTSGRNELRLVVTNAGDNVHSDHADWADAKLSCQ
jgi:hypothetical protein